MPYSGDPASSATNRVRFLVGDTSARPELTDAEIVDLLAQVDGAAVWAAPLAADALAAKFAHQVTYSAGRVSKSLSERAKAMRVLAASLRREAANYAVPVSTGQFRSTDTNDAQNAELKQPQFVLEQMDNRKTTRPRDTPTSKDDAT